MVGLGIVAIHAALIPLGPGGALVAPDLLYCLLVAWVIRRPARTPLWAVLALGLFADVMLSRPIGLGALGLMLVAEAFRRRAIAVPRRPLRARMARRRSPAFALMLAGMRSRSRWCFVDAARASDCCSRYLLATALAYPLVVLGLAWCLRLRAPRAAAGYRPGRAAMRPPAKPTAPRITRRGLMLLGLQAGAVGALAWRMRDLQVLQNEHYALLAEENRVNLRLIPPARGVILDRHGQLLAGNRQNYRITMVREQAGDAEAVLDRLGRIVAICRPTGASGR